MKKVVSLTRRAIEQYNMIEDGDKIAVGVSGGKDSLVLLNVLAELSRYYPKKFTVMGLTLDMGYDAIYTRRIRHSAGKKERHVPVRVRETSPLQLRRIYSFFFLPANLPRRPALRKVQKRPGHLLLRWLFLRQPHPLLSPSPAEEVLFSF